MVTVLPGTCSPHSDISPAPSAQELLPAEPAVPAEQPVAVPIERNARASTHYPATASSSAMLKDCLTAADWPS
jgi:hypothetical protein